MRHGDDGGEGEATGEVGEELEVERDADAQLVLEAEGRRRVERSPPLVRLPRRVEEPRLREGCEGRIEG